MGYAITSPAEKPRRRTTSSSQKTASGDFFALTEKSSLKNLCNPLKPRQGNTATPTKTASGVLYEHYRYTAFGEPEIYAPTGAKLASSAIDNTVLWNSRRYDADTNLYYYKYRHYKADIGRWLSRDPIEDIKGFYALYKTGFNLYDFTHHDPFNYYDNLGMEPISIGTTIFIGVVVGGVILIAENLTDGDCGGSPVGAIREYEVRVPCERDCHSDDLFVWCTDHDGMSNKSRAEYICTDGWFEKYWKFNGWVEAPTSCSAQQCKWCCKDNGAPVIYDDPEDFD